MLRLKLQYFGHLMGRTDPLEKIEDGRRRGTTEEEMLEWHHQCEGHEFE